MSKWTPGPWKHDDRVSSRVRDARDYTVASVLCDDRLVDDHLANAKLIAAAPELVKAVRDLLPLAGNWAGFIRRKDLFDKCDYASALLKRLED